jgi:hypothetical protein
VGALALPMVPEVDAALFRNPQTFREEIARACQPVVVRGAFSDWPVVAAGGSAEAVGDYLSRFASTRLAEVFIGERAIAGRYYYDEGLDGFNFERVEMDARSGIERVLESVRSGGSHSIYMGSLPADAYFPGFAAENPAPMLEASITPRIWFGNASHVSCHYDAVDNIACVVLGRRRFTLYPPDAIGDLYVGPIDHTMAGQPVSLAAGAAPDDPRYPRFAAACDRALVAELGPGDALYLPKLWWHQVEATAPVNLLVNYWWDGFAAGGDAPLMAMLLSMISIAERPPGEREAWRAFFDHYVFRTRGHPLAHLPEDKHGLLGPLKAGNYGRIRAIVMRALRGG